MVSTSRRVAFASLFSVLTLLTMGFLPAPTSDYLIAFESFFLALSFLVVGRGGATYVGAVSGILITFAKFQFFPYDLIFALLFGVSVDLLGSALRVKIGPDAMWRRVVAAMMLSTGLVGFLAYYVTAVATHIVPNDLSLDLSVLIFGVVSGALGGYLAALVWNKNLKARFQVQA